MVIFQTKNRLLSLKLRTKNNLLFKSVFKAINYYRTKWENEKDKKENKRKVENLRVLPFSNNVWRMSFQLAVFLQPFFTSSFSCYFSFIFPPLPIPSLTFFLSFFVSESQILFSPLATEKRRWADYLLLTVKDGSERRLNTSHWQIRGKHLSPSFCS